ncbi:PH domain-containing protein [Streptomyces sp. Qhu_M48]|uniref:PH domain-containing protein n=1 Tax=Streptomyces sp. Qhu_M48 TaxID=3435889 RepID=UPI003F5073D7
MGPASSLPSPARRLGSTGQNVALIAVGSLFLLLGAVCTVKVAHDLAGVIIYVSCAVLGVWIAVRGGSMGVRVDATGITERGLGRSRTIPWCKIREVSTTTQGIGPFRTGAPGLVLEDGAQVPLHALASASTTATATDIDTLTSAHAAHRAACGHCNGPARD